MKEEIKKMVGMTYKEFEAGVIEDFKKYLEGECIEETEINFEDVNNYIACSHFEIAALVESIEDIQYVEEEAENIIRKNFKINDEEE